MKASILFGIIIFFSSLGNIRAQSRSGSQLSDNSEMIGCIENKKKLLERTWQLKSVDVPGVVLTTEQKIEMEKSLLNTTTIQYVAGKVIYKTPKLSGTGYDITEYQWKLNNDCQRVTVINSKDKSMDTIKIKVTDRMLIIDQVGLGTMTFVPKF